MRLLSAALLCILALALNPVVGSNATAMPAIPTDQACGTSTIHPTGGFITATATGFATAAEAEAAAKGQILLDLAAQSSIKCDYCPGSTTIRCTKSAVYLGNNPPAVDSWPVGNTYSASAALIGDYAITCFGGC